MKSSSSHKELAERIADKGEEKLPGILKDMKKFYVEPNDPNSVASFKKKFYLFPEKFGESALQIGSYYDLKSIRCRSKPNRFKLGTNNKCVHWHLAAMGKRVIHQIK